MITFRIQDHVIRNVQVVEILDGDRLLGTIYPQEWGIRLVSKYLSPCRVTLEADIPPVLEVRLP
jgi:hypothetical protein